ncbi:acyltransferase [uncultured Thiodictyon sp.]|uniref:acyltransferase family protein n=1 Tax=uncultured Thiodictyon sp. TaxID=1846217 RepID=UPI0025D5C02B|nr:acyltransferase [uncultured Thiodictyon sp.]
MAGKTQPMLDSIQALRGLAALLVVMLHSELELTVPGLPVFDWVTEHVVQRGNAGVDIFFVISGFIIAWIAVLGRAAPEGPLEFAVRRFFRVAPVYWLLSAVYVSLFNPLGWTGLMTSLAFLPTDAQSAPLYGSPALFVGWSLNYEVFFYAVCMGALFAGRRALVIVAAVLFFTTLVVPAVRFGYIDLDPAHSYPFAGVYWRMIANPLILEFLLGCATAWLFAKTRERLTPAIAGWLLAVGVTAFCLSLVIVYAPFSLVWRGLPAVLLLFGALAVEQTGLLPIPRWSVRLGALSYGLYLAHPLIIEGLKHLTTPLAPTAIGLQLIRFAVILGLGLGLAALVHRYLEGPSIVLGRCVAKRLRCPASAPGRAAAPAIGPEPPRCAPVDC